MESITCNILHQDTILIPYKIEIVDISTHNRCGHINIFAFADSEIVTGRVVFVRNSKFKLERFSESTSRNNFNLCIAFCCTFSSRLGHFDKEFCSFSHHSRECARSCRRNKRTCGFAFFLGVPLIGQVIHVVIAKVSSGSNHTAFADGVNIEGDSYVDVGTDVNIVGLAVGNTTVVVCCTHSEYISMILICQGCIECLIIEDKIVSLAINNIVAVYEGLVIQTPFVGIISVLSRCMERVIQISNKANIVAVANPRIASNLDSRVRKNN